MILINKSAVVVGAGIGGLSSAIYLASQGFHVTLVESNETLGGRANVISASGYRFDTGPSLLNYPWVFEELFSVAGKILADELELLKIDPAINFFWPDGSNLELSSDLFKLSQELERFDPGSSSGLLKFLSDARLKYEIAFSRLVTRNSHSVIGWFRSAGLSNLMKLGLFRSMDSQLSKYFKSQRIKEALGSYAMYLGGSPHQLRGIFSILPYGELHHGLWFPKGGIYSLVEKISEIAQLNGVKIINSTRVEQIITKDSMVIGVRTSNNAFIQADIVVSNVDVKSTQKLLNDDVRYTRKLRMTPGVITFYMGIKKKFDNVTHHTIFLNNEYQKSFKQIIDGGRIPDNPPFYISIPSNSDPDLAPKGSSSVFVLVPVPTLSHHRNVNWPATVSQIRASVKHRLSQHGISFEESDVEFEEIWTPVDWKNKFGLHDGSAFGAAHLIRQIGPFRPPNKSNSIKGLYYVGASTTPGTGLPMCVLSGKMVAERISKDFG